MRGRTEYRNRAVERVRKEENEERERERERKTEGKKYYRGRGT
jgi:hypothetical protein